MAEVRLVNIHKTYRGGVEAVKNLNLTIQDGEFLALLGPSGCGKTSTLRMIVGLEKITSGQIYIGDRLVNDLEPNKRNVALAFESYALYPPLSIRENIAFCLRARKIDHDEIKRRVNEAAHILDISDILDRKPAELSGGQKQRVSLARALVRDPDVFLMDEPLSHLDASQRAHMRIELKRLHAKTKRTTVLVTHDQLEAVAMAERIAVMNLGVLQQVGSFEEIYNRPVNEFVAGFIGEPPMNLLATEAKSDNGVVFLQALDGSFRLGLPPELKQAVERSGTRQINVGIRPIDVLASSNPMNGSAFELEGLIYTFEALGEEGQLAVQIGAKQVLAVTSHLASFKQGEKVWLQPRTDRLHLFNAATGERL